MPNSPETLAKLKASQDPDAMVLWQMAKIGADLTKPHEPDFAFEAAERKDAEAIAAELEAFGYDVEVCEPEDENPNYRTIAKRTMVLDLHVLNQISQQFETLATKYGASYDGWGTEIVE